MALIQKVIRQRLKTCGQKSSSLSTKPQSGRQYVSRWGQANFVCLEAPDVTEAQAQFIADKPDLILLIWMLLGVSDEVKNSEINLKIVYHRGEPTPLPYTKI